MKIPFVNFYFYLFVVSFFHPLTSAIAWYFSLGSPLKLSNPLEVPPHVQPWAPLRLFFASSWSVGTYYEESIWLFCWRLSVSSSIVYFDVMVIFVACKYWFCAPLVFKITLFNVFVFIITSSPRMLGQMFCSFFIHANFSWYLLDWAHKCQNITNYKNIWGHNKVAPQRLYYKIVN